MARVIIKHALRKHKEFIINANKKINEINHIKQTNNLEKNIENDYYGYAPKFECLIAEVDNEPVGMVIYSKYYWANEGEALWISQIFVDRKYRKYGVFIRLIRKIREENKDIKFITCGVKRGNKKTRKILSYYNANEPDFNFYYINYNENNKSSSIKKAQNTKESNNDTNESIKEDNKKGSSKNLNNNVKDSKNNGIIMYDDIKNKIAN